MEIAYINTISHEKVKIKKIYLSDAEILLLERILDEAVISIASER